MEDRHVLQLIQNLIDRFEYLGEAQFDLDSELQLIVHPITRVPLALETLKKIEDTFLERIQYRRSHDGAVLIPVSIVSDPREHEEWYDDWLNRNNNASGSYYWKRLEDFLSKDLTTRFGPETAGTIVKSIDEATSSTLRKIANPSRNQFSHKGLVLGYVQSGKTANFTALIAKAADAGYRFIVVLSGIHSVLRRQTQLRLDRELTGMNDLGIAEAFIDEPSDIKRWNRFTTTRLRQVRTRNGDNRVYDLGEFDTVNVDPFDSICNRATPSLAIIKKNVSVLDRLIEYILESSETNRRNMPVLVIDDEADQASINTNANDPDSDPTSINARIRTLLGLFPRKTYVGYTATPFANVLIDMDTEHGELADDLYPRNFIVSLPKPNGYFGTSMIFQGNLAASFVNEIPDEANELIRHVRMTENLSLAIDQFVLCCAVRDIRGDRYKPMSMLVHVSHRISDMGIISNIVNSYIKDIAGRYKDKRHSGLLKEHFNKVWNDFVVCAEAINRELTLKNQIPDFDPIWEELANVFNALQVIELNSASDDVLDYTTDREIKVIAVGGNQLTRGLTLEGLMTSYYLRASKQYDTLLQMGRWFGYRRGYEDLTRIHTTEQIWEFFEHLALVEEELRSEIYRYEEEGKTPAQLALAIRDHRKLSVTARNKMGAARLRQSSYSDSLNQTLWFPLDRPEILKSNLHLGSSFVQKIKNEVGFTNVNESGVHLANQKINGERILKEFLNRYNFVDKESSGGPGLDADSLLAYIFRRLSDQDPELTQWSLAVVGNANPTASDDPISFGGISINRIQRSRKYTLQGFNVGVLTEPDHLKIDLADGEERSSQNPLLLLYLVWKGSKAGKPIDHPLPGQRIDLFRFVTTELIDVLGIGIKLPRSQYEPNSYVGQ